MKAITTKYIGPGNVRGSRVKATDSDGNNVTLSSDHALNPEENHREACRALCHKMDWEGTLIGGHLKTGMAWVFQGSTPCVVFNCLKPH